MTEAFRVMLEAKLSSFREWRQSRHFTHYRLVEYLGCECLGGMDMDADEVESQFVGMLSEGFRIDWAEQGDWLYLCSWEGASEYKGAPEWTKVFAEEHLRDLNGPLFDTDEEFIAYLKTLNPEGAEAPKNFNYTAVTREAKELYQRFRSELGEEIQFDGDGSIQDASFHSAILIPPSSQLRLSNFKYLATITSEESLSQETLARGVEILVEFGYLYVPFRLFGEPFFERERFEGDLFIQLFDYL